MAKKQVGPIPFGSLCVGYRLAVTSAFDLLTASLRLMDQPPAALALAELGQEELGKSLSILAAISLSADPAAWRWFWSVWRNHTVKAHRAFLYELISPTRIEIEGPDGKRLAGASLRASLPMEKEIGVYIAYDENQSRFVSPAEAIGRTEAHHRSLTLLYLAYTAHAVLRTLESRADLLWYRLFSEVAYTICTAPLYQQHMARYLAAFASRSTEHTQLVKALSGSLLVARSELTALFESEAPG